MGEHAVNMWEWVIFVLQNEELSGRNYHIVDPITIMPSLQQDIM
jgi:hypothetical protein